MDVSAAITTRRAVRKFDPDYTIPEKDLEALLALTIQSPTAFNMQNWRFVVVEDQALRDRIKTAAWDQSQVTDASALVILCADLLAWNREPIRYWRSAPESTLETFVPAINRFYDGLDQNQRDEAMRSCGIAAQTLMLAATSMGYDTCPMDGFDFDAVGQLINLPEDHAICMFVAIGKALEAPAPSGDKLPLRDIMVVNRFEQSPDLLPHTQ